MSNDTPRLLTVEGQPADGAPQGYTRLNLTPEGDQYVDVVTDGIHETEEIESERPPFIGQRVTRLTIQQNTPITFTSRYLAPRPEDFDAAAALVDMHKFPGVGDWMTPGLISRMYCPRP